MQKHNNHLGTEPLPAMTLIVWLVLTVAPWVAVILLVKAAIYLLGEML